MPRGRKRKEEKASGKLDGQDMLMRITNAYIGQATDEQRRLIYEYTMKILSESTKTDEAEKPADESKAEEIKA